MFFERDAGSVETAQAVVLFGQKTIQLNIPVCGYCGFKDCAENAKKGARVRSAPATWELRYARRSRSRPFIISITGSCSRPAGRR